MQQDMNITFSAGGRKPTEQFYKKVGVTEDHRYVCIKTLAAPDSRRSSAAMFSARAATSRFTINQTSPRLAASQSCFRTWRRPLRFAGSRRPLLWPLLRRGEFRGLTTVAPGLGWFPQAPLGSTGCPAQPRSSPVVKPCPSSPFAMDYYSSLAWVRGTRLWLRLMPWV